MKQKISRLLAEYGVIALVLHYVIFGIVLVGSYFALRAGWSPTSTAGKAGTWGAAYIITKIVQIPRIALTVIMTPFVARVWERTTGMKPGGISLDRRGEQQGSGGDAQ